MDIKVLQKSNTFSSLSTGGQKIGSWFDRRARKISMKCSKSISVLGKAKIHFLVSVPFLAIFCRANARLVAVICCSGKHVQLRIT